MGSGLQPPTVHMGHVYALILAAALALVSLAVLVWSLLG